MNWFSWGPRKSSAGRRADAARAIQDAARRGQALSPVAIAGRTIAHTFWGKAWCDNLERYQDFAYRLDRGRSYLRSGSVIDLQIRAGAVAAKVSGSQIYDVAIKISAVAPTAWRAIRSDCAGGIGSRIDLLSGRLSEPVMARLCADQKGLFPAPSAIEFTCSCPDYATMCKHVAAVMYGVGARLDQSPELLFTLRKASLDELVASAASELPPTPSAGRVLAAEGLASLFGIELAEPSPSVKPRASSASGTRKPATAARSVRRTGEPPAAKQSATKLPAAKQSAAKQSAAKQSAAKQSAAKLPAAKQSAAKQSAAKQSADKQSAAKLPAAKQSAKLPAAKLPAAKLPAAKLPAAKLPAAK